MSASHLDTIHASADHEAAYLSDLLHQSGPKQAYDALLHDVRDNTSAGKAHKEQNYLAALTDQLQEHGVLPVLSAEYLVQNNSQLSHDQHISKQDLEKDLAQLKSSKKVESSVDQLLLHGAIDNFGPISNYQPSIGTRALDLGLRSGSSIEAYEFRQIRDFEQHSGKIESNKKHFSQLLDKNGKMFAAFSDTLPDGRSLNVITPKSLNKFISDPYHPTREKEAALELLAQLHTPEGYNDSYGVASWSRLSNQGMITRESLDQGLGRVNHHPEIIMMDGALPMPMGY